MKYHFNTWMTCFISGLLLHLQPIHCNPNGYAISNNGAKPTSFYRAPSHYGRGNPLQSFIITSRPITFHSDPNKQEGNSLKLPLIQTKPKASLTSVPGIATVVCKGISCAGSPMSFSDWPSADDDGFPGEAIPIVESEYMTAMVGQHQPEIIADVPTASTIKQASTQSKVHLLTNRPYLRGSSKRKTRAPTRKTYVEQHSTIPATSRSTTATTRKRPVAQAQVSSSTVKPVSSTIRPTFTFQRPSLVFPAMAAFSLMALPVAAAAVPLLLQGRRKKRSLQLPLSLDFEGSSLDDSSTFPEMDFMELMSSLENLESGNESVEWPKGLGHMVKVTKAKHRMQKFKNKWMRQK